MSIDEPKSAADATFVLFPLKICPFARFAG
jgi:hypothetical protein